MAYNLAQYNLTAYNSGSDSDLWINAIFSENVTPVLGTSSETYLLAVGNEKVLSAGIMLGNGVYISAAGGESVAKDILGGMSSVVLGSVIGYETITEEATAQCLIHPPTVGLEQITGDIHMGAVIMPSYATGSETVNAIAVTDKETYLIVSGYELVSSSVNLEAVDIIVCELNITLKPGQKLIVDATNYNVLLDNENAIWAQSGAWIDELTRETSSISINASSGVANLSANILYTERYL